MKLKKNTFIDFRIECKNNDGKMEWEFLVSGIGYRGTWIASKRKNSIKTVEEAFAFFISILKKDIKNCDKKETRSSSYHHLIRGVLQDDKD